jgi:DNA-binding transcriptional regulator/RsmH inhibitor MraZ
MSEIVTQQGTPVAENAPEFLYFHERSIDKQARIAFPVEWRELGAGPEFYVSVWSHPPTKKPNACLKFFTKSGFQRLKEQLLNIKAGDPRDDALKRRIFGQSQRLTLDPMNRLCLPGTMVSQVGIKTPGTARFIGLGAEFQLWSPETLAECEAADIELAGNFG